MQTLSKCVSIRFKCLNEITHLVSEIGVFLSQELLSITSQLKSVPKVVQREQEPPHLPSRLVTHTCLKYMLLQPCLICKRGLYVARMETKKGFTDCLKS